MNVTEICASPRVAEGCSGASGTLATMSAEAALTAAALPPLFVAVTSTRILWSMSAVVSVCDAPFSSGMSTHEAPLELQRRHWRVYVIDCEPVHVPGSAFVIACPRVTLPPSAGGAVFVGAIAVTTGVAAEVAE